MTDIKLPPLAGVAIGTGSSNNQLDKEGSENFVNSLFKNWINPEIQNRKNAGKLPKDFVLRNVQLVMYANGTENEIRLNEEVKVHLVVRKKKGLSFKKNDPVRVRDIEEIIDARPSGTDDPNAAHIILVYFQGYWHVRWNLRYNTKMCNERFEAAQDYLDLAKVSMDKKRWRPFADNLFTCTELLAQVELLSMPIIKFVKKQTHRYTSSLYNNHIKAGNAKIDYAKNLGRLSSMRDDARYFKGTFSLSANEANQFLDVTIKMLEYTKSRLNIWKKSLDSIKK